MKHKLAAYHITAESHDPNWVSVGREQALPQKSLRGVLTSFNVDSRNIQILQILQYLFTFKYLSSI